MIREFPGTPNPTNMDDGNTRVTGQKLRMMSQFGKWADPARQKGRTAVLLQFGLVFTAVLARTIYTEQHISSKEQSSWGGATSS